MPKGVIVLDMPESCAKCPFFQDIYCDMMCKVNGRTIDYTYPKDYKQEWCPIRQFPEKDRENYVRADSYWQKQGWNACISAITGEEG